MAMAYPPSSLPGIAADAQMAPVAHAAHHSEQRAAINSVVDVLGYRPQGDFATVDARIDDLEARVTALGG